MAALLLSIVLPSCDNEENQPSGSGTVTVKFDNRVGDTNLNLDTEDYPYSNDLGQEFKVSMLRYYISNVKLKRTDGTYYEDEVSDDGSKGYYLVDEANPESTELNLKNVPAGDYDELSFVIGVDASRVTEGVQTGALYPANDMFWSWNAGYIFVRFEGFSPVPTETNNGVIYHIGGYKSDPSNPGLVDNIRERKIAITEGLSVKKDANPMIHLKMDLLEFFKDPNAIDFSSNASRHSPAACTDIVENYVKAFTFDHIHE